MSAHYTVSDALLQVFQVPTTACSREPDTRGSIPGSAALLVNVHDVPFGLLCDSSHSFWSRNVRVLEFLGVFELSLHEYAYW